jgi:hypothetical protein
MELEHTAGADQQLRIHVLYKVIISEVFFEVIILLTDLGRDVIKKSVQRNTLVSISTHSYEIYFSTNLYSRRHMINQL